MRVKENYFPLISLAFVLTVAILILFQVYIFERAESYLGGDGAR